MAEAILNGMTLHNFFRSSTSHRLRIALALKGLDYRYLAYRLRADAHRTEAYRRVNAQMLVPSIEFEDGRVITQSLAAIEYLDEMVPAPSLLPPDALGRARVRSLAQLVALDIHPINNLRVLNELRARFGADDAAIAAWFTHWVTEGFTALEIRLAREPETGRFCHGDEIGLADICLAAQVTSNERFGTPIEGFPTIARINTACAANPSFRAAHPSAQPDAE